jgi:hypothetical protein
VITGYLPGLQAPGILSLKQRQIADYRRWLSQSNSPSSVPYPLVRIGMVDAPPQAEDSARTTALDADSTSDRSRVWWTGRDGILHAHAGQRAAVARSGRKTSGRLFTVKAESLPSASSSGRGFRG